MALRMKIMWPASANGLASTVTVGRRDEDVGTASENNGEQSRANLPTSSKRKPLVVYWGLRTSRSSHVRDVWGDSAISSSAWQHLVLPKWSNQQEGRQGGWPEKPGAQGVRAFMFFHWVYGFPLSVWFSFEFMGFLWIYGCPLDLWFSFGSTSVSFLWVHVTLMLFRIWV